MIVHRNIIVQRLNIWNISAWKKMLWAIMQKNQLFFRNFVVTRVPTSITFPMAVNAPIYSSNQRREWQCYGTTTISTQLTDGWENLTPTRYTGAVTWKKARNGLAICGSQPPMGLINKLPVFIWTGRIFTLLKRINCKLVDVWFACVLGFMFLFYQNVLNVN